MQLGGAGVKCGTHHTQHKPISIVINHKFIRPLAISMLGNFSLGQIGQPNLAQPDFHTLYKSVQCSPKHELFLDFLVSCDMRSSAIHTYTNFQKMFHIFLFGRLFKSVNIFPPLFSIWRKSFFTVWTKTVSVRPSVNENLFCQWHLIDEIIGHLST